MRTLHHASKTFSADLAAFCRGAVVPREIADSVAAILADVRARGDEALSYYAAKFDGAKLRGRGVHVTGHEQRGAVVVELALGGREVGALEGFVVVGFVEHEVRVHRRHEVAHLFREGSVGHRGERRRTVVEQRRREVGSARARWSRAERAQQGSHRERERASGARHLSEAHASSLHPRA